MIDNFQYNRIICCGYGFRNWFLRLLNRLKMDWYSNCWKIEVHFGFGWMSKVEIGFVVGSCFVLLTQPLLQVMVWLELVTVFGVVGLVVAGLVVMKVIVDFVDSIVLGAEKRINFAFVERSVGKLIVKVPHFYILLVRLLSYFHILEQIFQVLSLFGCYCTKWFWNYWEFGVFHQSDWY